eukprot:10228011-Ditylum_brightwellii.AAC.1
MAILLENNGHNTREEDQAYGYVVFFVTNCEGAGEIEIEYCPTKLIRGFFSKPVQKRAFKKSTALILTQEQS